MKWLLLFFVGNVMAAEPDITKLNEPTHFYTPSRILYCSNCPPEIIKQIKDWEAAYLDDYEKAVQRKHNHDNALVQSQPKNGTGSRSGK